ncbi:hypothetical protein TTHERM_00264780 (macronuclear) [Tetrahymena thermophila SB210]|uniref:Uncharacterized protein n=1 Tax=Tetrahymena thermophila (strain SB210) TaxID=312017 RepID=Q22U04_TETTS|nr:hypothetical protein TTHERM_00264780 [Tetrahymena thermophila SB210]EAR88883.1 hypothetical protein TTHERM_00264780 [Tetrahymena thermophila SB210]|eukprot:XP_001009128.1 hypothetical protein TTHERM_00264780 [Tetrahymena thermophila SB210]
MNTIIKKTIILAAVAFITYLTFTNLQSTQFLKKETIACDEGLYYCFSQCREYESCEKLQRDFDRNMNKLENGDQICIRPMHLCGDGRCYSGWCPQ